MKEKKTRVPIPETVVAELMYETQNTCCICNVRGKAVQVHHVDEDHSNNSPANLVVLCLDCHNEVHRTGGFGRKYDVATILLYAKKWKERVQRQREEADRLASFTSVMGTTVEEAIADEITAEDELDLTIEVTMEQKSEVNENQQEPDEDWWEVPEAVRITFENYIFKVAEIRQTLVKFAQKKWDTGVTATVLSATGEISDFYSAILENLFDYYPSGHWGEQDAKHYVNEKVGDITRWHWQVGEPFGKARSGTMASVIVAHSVMEELERMVKDMVGTLCVYKMGTDYEKWLCTWEGTEWKEKPKAEEPNKIVESEAEPQQEEIKEPASFPGGNEAWNRYLTGAINRDIPASNGAPPGKYTVVIKFVIDQMGMISKVEKLNDPGYGTAREAMRVISNSPIWTAARVNGHPVAYSHNQSITFVVDED